MKTVFQRALSVIMCVVLVVCTMSTMAYAADEFTYDKFFDKTSKSVDMNIIPAIDAVEEVLTDDMVYDIDAMIKDAGISFDTKIGVIDLSSVNGILNTIYHFSDIIEDLWIIKDLQPVTFSEFETGMSREKSGDAKIIAELVDLLGSNGDIFGEIISGEFSLGALDALFEGEEGEDGFSFSEIPGLAKELFVSLVYDEETEKDKFDAALNKANANFDNFICEDLIPAIVGIVVESAGLDTAEHNISINTSTTVNSLIAQVFDILLAYVKTTISDLNIVFAGTSLNGIKDELILYGIAPEALNGIAFDGDKPVIDQINTVVGQIFEIIVPKYMASNEWGTDLGANVSNVFRYLAAKVGITTDDKNDEAIMVDVLKMIFAEPEVNVPGDYSECATMEDIAKELIRTVAVKKYEALNSIDYSSKTYLHVLGDIIIAEFQDDVIIATPDGKICKVGDGYDVWTVWNYILNFFLVDKNLDLLIGRDGMTKTSTFFDKLDSIFGLFSDDGTLNYKTETYFKGLIGSIMDVDLNKFVDHIAGKALKFAKEGDNGASGSVSVSKFVYKGLYAVLRNWAGKRDVIPAWTTNPFHNAFEGENLGNAVEAILTALTGYKCNVKEGLVSKTKTLEKVGTSRAPAITSLIGLLVKGPVTASIDNASVADLVYTGKALNPKAVVEAVFAGKTFTLEQNVDYKVTVAKNAIGNTTATIEGIGAYDGQVTVPVKIVFGKLSGLKAAPASTSSVKLSWNKLAGANSYNIYNGSTLVKSGVTANSYTVTGLKAGTKYTFKIEAVNGSTKSAQATASTVTYPAQVGGLKATTPSNTSVKLTWNKVSGAAGYYVQQYKSGKWQTVKTVTANNVTLSASANTAYSFRVIAYTADSAGTKYNGTASATVSVRTAPNKPSSFAKKTVTASTVELSWKKVSGATGYEIYDSKGNKVGSTKSTSYTVKKLSAKTTYKYKVRAYTTVGGKTYYSDFTSTVSATTLLAAPKSFKVKSVTATSIKLSWKKVSGAKKYQVYYSTNGKKWKKATTSKNSYTISDLKANTSFKIKVRAYNSSSVYGDYTSVISTSTAPSKVSLSKLSAGKKKFTATWKKVSGASGYEVQYATNSKFKKAKTVTINKGKTVKAEVKKLKKGTKYYVRVRAFKTVDGKKIYGKYCEYETVKVK